MLMGGTEAQPVDGYNKFLYNGKEYINNTDLNLSWYDYGARMYDPQLGRWHSVDPMTEKYYSLTPYNYVANNPLLYVDPNGEVIVDMNGNEVVITWDKDGNIQYQYSSSYSEEELAKVKSNFESTTGTIFSAMNVTKNGRMDIQSMIDLSTKIRIDPTAEGGNPNWNSTIIPGEIMENGEYDKATIIPNMDNISLNAKNSNCDNDEMLIAVMSVESGHLEPDQIQKELNVKDFNKMTDEEFQTIYQGLFNYATENRVQYRIAKSQKVTISAAERIEKYKHRGITYERYVKKLLKKHGVIVKNK